MIDEFSQINKTKPTFHITKFLISYFSIILQHKTPIKLTEENFIQIAPSRYDI